MAEERVERVLGTHSREKGHKMPSFRQDTAIAVMNSQHLQLPRMGLSTPSWDRARAQDAIGC